MWSQTFSRSQLHLARDLKAVDYFHPISNTSISYVNME